ncbi:uncharacterized protein LOC144379055 [Halichoerus grypus]
MAPLDCSPLWPRYRRTARKTADACAFSTLCRHSRSHYQHDDVQAFQTDGAHWAYKAEHDPLPKKKSTWNERGRTLKAAQARTRQWEKQQIGNEIFYFSQQPSALVPPGSKQNFPVGGPWKRQAQFPAKLLTSMIKSLKELICLQRRDEAEEI